MDIEPYYPHKITDCELVIIGEAPGKEEKEQGKPFVGRAGKLLDSALEENNIDKNQVYITNVFWDKPDNNNVNEFFITGTLAKRNNIEISERFLKKSTNYLIKEHEHNLDRLDDEISIVDPSIIMCLGNTPLWALLGEEKISHKRGCFFDVTHLSKSKGKFFMPTWHPAAVLRDKDNKHEQFVNDINKIAKIIQS